MARFKRCDRCGIEVPIEDDGIFRYTLIADDETRECERDLCGGCVMRVIEVMKYSEVGPPEVVLHSEVLDDE